MFNRAISTLIAVIALHSPLFAQPLSKPPAANLQALAKEFFAWRAITQPATHWIKLLSVEVFFQEESFWLSQRRMAELFDVEVHTINYHLKEIYASGELMEPATIRKIRIVQNEGEREVSREVDFYNLDAIIAVGYRVNSRQATQFRHNAGNVSHEVAKALAEEAYSKFRVTQERSFESDFEKAAK